MNKYNDLLGYKEWIDEHPEKFEFMVALITNMMDKRAGKIKRIIIHEILFPYRGIFMGIQIEPTPRRIVDESGKEHAILFFFDR